MSKRMEIDTERHRSTLIDDDVGFGGDGVVVPNRVANPKPKRNEVVNTDIYPGGAVKTFSSITPNLRLKTHNNRTLVVGQISVTLLGGLQGEPIVCLYVLAKNNEQIRRMGEYDLGSRVFDFRSICMRPALGTPMRPKVYDGWEIVTVSSRVKDGYGYQGEGSSLEEKSLIHHIPTIKRFTMNETRPDNPFVTIYGEKIGVVLYHIEVWHSGKCVGIRDGSIGTGFVSAPCKDWFAPGRNPQHIRY